MSKSSIFCLILVGLAVVFAFSGSADAQEHKVRIGVMSFENSSPGAEEDGGAIIGSGMADILVNELSRGNRNYEIVERAQLDKTFAEISGGNAGAFDETTSREIGKALGLNYIVIGDLMATIRRDSIVNIAGLSRIPGIKAGTATANVVVNIKVIEVETGKLVISERSEANEEMGASVGVGSDANTDAVTMSNIGSVAHVAITRVANQIKKRVAPAEYTVLSVKRQAKGGEVVVDIGRDDGANVLQRYKIVREGDVITNPRTGEIIDTEKIEIATVTITMIDANMSTARIDALYQGEIIDNKGKKKKIQRTIERGDIVRPF